METVKKCIYCLETKPISQFNIEHVVPKVFGAYKNSLTLHECQVCTECNTYFSKTLETDIALNSIEAFFKMHKGQKPMSDGRKIKRDRLKIQGDIGIIKGLKYNVVSDNSNAEKMRFEPLAQIGFKFNDGEEYEYFFPEEIPEKTQEIADKLNTYGNKVVFWGMTGEEAKIALIESGYNEGEREENIDITSVYSGDTILIKQDIRLDNISFRLMSKIAFNYLTYTYGTAFVSDSKFDNIRNYIRYGCIAEKMKVLFSFGKVLTYPTENAHLIGLAWGDETYKSLYGIVSLYSTVNYRIMLTSKMHGLCFKLPLSIFDNETREISCITENRII